MPLPHTSPLTLELWRMLQIVGIGASQSAAAAVSNLVGGPAAAASPGPPDAITSALAGMTRKQLYDIMAQMKGLIVQNPGQVILPSSCDATVTHFSSDHVTRATRSFAVPEEVPSALLRRSMRGEAGRHSHDALTQDPAPERDK